MNSSVQSLKESITLFQMYVLQLVHHLQQHTVLSDEVHLVKDAVRSTMLLVQVVLVKYLE